MNCGRLLGGQCLVEQACKIWDRFTSRRSGLWIFNSTSDFFVGTLRRGSDIKANHKWQGLDQTTLLLEQGGKADATGSMAGWCSNSRGLQAWCNAGQTVLIRMSRRFSYIERAGTMESP